MATASAIAIAAAFNSADPRTHPLARNVTLDTSLSTPDQYEALLGRKLRPTPSHLTSRVLYLPSHNDKVAHLPVYDFTAEFGDVVRDEPVGGSRFKTRLGLMAKPVGDGRGPSEVSYLVDFEPLEARRPSLPGGPSDPVGMGMGVGGGIGHGRRKSSLTTMTTGLATNATVQKRSLYGGGAEVGLAIPPLAPLGPDTEDGAVACTLAPRSTTINIPLVTLFPVEPTTSRFGSSRNPWFTFTVPSLLDDERTLQWQIHPVEQGSLRYTLVEIPHSSYHYSPSSNNNNNNNNAASQDEENNKTKKPPFSASEEENEGRIRAIYHNVGLGFSLAQPFSEGALLLQDGLDAELEALIVASLLGLLWRVRNETARPPRKGSKPDVGGGSVGIRMGRKGSVDEERRGLGSPGSSPVSPGKKRFFGRILGKK